MCQPVRMAPSPEPSRDPARVRLGRIIAEHRDSTQLTQAQLAYRADVATNTLFKLERGDKVKDKSMWAVERALGWPRGTMRRVLDGDEPPDPEPASRSQLQTEAQRIRRLLAELDDTVASFLEAVDEDR